MFFEELDIATGDILFFKKDGSSDNNSEFMEAIATVGAESVIHVAFIYIIAPNKLGILHAVPELGVCREFLPDVINVMKPDSLEIFRVDRLPPDVRIRAYQWAVSKIGTRYNDVFSPEMRDSAGYEAYYCCQLIIRSYEALGIMDFCMPHKLNFKGIDGKILPYWAKYYRIRSSVIPQGAPGSHPAILIRSKYLVRHFSKICMSKGKFTIPKTIDSALHFVRGARVIPKASRFFNVYQPRNGEILTRCSCASNELVDEVVKDSHEVLQSWSNFNAQKRGVILRKAASIIRSFGDQLAYWETVDCGKPIEESRWDITCSANTFEFFAGTAHNIAGNHFSLGGDRYAYTERLPWGTIGAIGVWNYPVQTASWKIAPALMCGNVVVYKPSPLAPITSVLLAQILQAAGLPDGVLSVLQGDGETGQAICEHSGISKVTFTGSSETGCAILRSCSLLGKIKPATLELGGKSAMIICEDADIDMAVTGAFMANFFCQGEVCSNASKILVHISCYDKFRRKVVERAKRLVIGDPLLKETKIGATISPEHLMKVKYYIDEAVQQGATLLCGGDRVTVKGLENGYYLSPAILDCVNQQMRIYKEEVFGAAMLIIPFEENEASVLLKDIKDDNFMRNDAIRMANDTQYGLAAGLFTRNLHLAYSIASKLQAGNVYINTFNDTNPMIPFGGMKQSGFGRENGIAALEVFSQSKSVFVNASDKLVDPFL
ncbi:unnamed protein product [Thelazia callipaeda]|uniref:Aldedh domain-containing protein n=1 Tax=Thelazia callipaeda TaxID=103827 RepID=A0A0N5CWX1_THECL|nr:unnamed protein product [Thelazia callipaeda]